MNRNLSDAIPTPRPTIGNRRNELGLRVRAIDRVELCQRGCGRDTCSHRSFPARNTSVGGTLPLLDTPVSTWASQQKRRPA